MWDSVQKRMGMCRSYEVPSFSQNIMYRFMPHNLWEYHTRHNSVACTKLVAAP